MISKADLHIHSLYSDRSAEWILRKLNFPDSYSKPADLYQKLKDRGMDFVTITDHNRIEGCLEIAHLPGTFISEDISTYFPEDRCRVNLLAWDIQESQHHEIQALRQNIYELRDYLAAQNIAHAVSHPLFRLDEKFSIAHFEKLLLLFKTFEGINGLRDELLSTVFQEVVSKLTPGKIEELANRHNLSPTHSEPWKKILTGGSDDHGGMFPAHAYTETPAATSAQEFIGHLREGKCTPKGKGGDPLTLSHGFYNTIHSYASDRFLKKHNFSILEKAFSRFMEGNNPTEFTFKEKIELLAQGVASGKIFDLVKPANASVWKQFASYFAETDVKKMLAETTAGVTEPSRRAFLIANFFVNQVAFRFFTKFVKDISSGNIIESIQGISTLIPIYFSLSPYIYSFQSQAPSRKWLRDLSESVSGETPAHLKNSKRAWFTDTLEDVNGVANTIRRMTSAAVKDKQDVVVVTSRSSIHITDIPIKNFQPIGEFELPEYELQKLSFPPILEIIDYIQREKFTEVIISTPGPIGITALIAAKMLGLKTSGIYHTDFPQYVRILTDDTFLETLTWNFMHWFYSQLDLVFVNSEHYRQCWIDRGIAAEKIQILPRGLDLELFHPTRRDREFWKDYNLNPNGNVVLLYVGRVSKEKDLDVLASAYRTLKDEKLPVDLVFVGDGPYLKELKNSLPEACFTGYLQGEKLARAFASADVFAFPSTTDTFGNVVLEALASGLPTVVSDLGGPKELIAHQETGFITKALDTGDFTQALRKLVHDSTLREKMKQQCRPAVQDRDWGVAFHKFWAMSDN